MAGVGPQEGTPKVPFSGASGARSGRARRPRGPVRVCARRLRPGSHPPEACGLPPSPNTLAARPTSSAAGACSFPRVPKGRPPPGRSIAFDCVRLRRSQPPAAKAGSKGLRLAAWQLLRPRDCAACQRVSARGSTRSGRVHASGPLPPPRLLLPRPRLLLDPTNPYRTPFPACRSSTPPTLGACWSALSSCAAKPSTRTAPRVPSASCGARAAGRKWLRGGRRRTTPRRAACGRARICAGSLCWSGYEKGGKGGAKRQRCVRWQCTSAHGPQRGAALRAALLASSHAWRS